MREAGCDGRAQGSPPRRPGRVMGVLMQRVAPVHKERSRREVQSWVPEPDPGWCCLWMREKLWEKLVGGWGGWARISVLEALHSRCP